MFLRTVVSNRFRALGILRNLSSLTKEQRSIVEREKGLFGRMEDLVRFLDEKQLGKEDKGYLKLIQRTRWHLEELFLIVIVGEFNSGKSQFVNAMLNMSKTPICKVGVTPTTAGIQILTKSTDTANLTIYRPEELKHIENIVLSDAPGLPSWLETANIVDTPGTNAIVEGHQEITEEFVPRADLILFVTSAERPFSESERKFLQSIQIWGKKIVFIVNKMDTLESEEDTRQVLEFVKISQRQISKEPAQVFPISAKFAQGVDKVQEYVANVLGDKEKLLLKLRNPIGVAEHVLDEIEQKIIGVRRTYIEEDIKVASYIEDQSAQFRKEILRDFEYQKSQMDNIMLRFLTRCDEFISEDLRLEHSFDFVFSPGKIQEKFMKQVVSGYSTEIDNFVESVSQWLQSKLASHSSRILHQVVRRAEYHKSEQKSSHIRFPSDLSMINISERQNVFQKFNRASKDLIDSFDDKQASLHISKKFRNAVFQTALVQASAVGVGALFVVSAFDFTGITGSGVLALSSLLIIPHRKHMLKRQLSQQINRLRKDLKESIQVHFEREVEESMRSTLSSISSYTHFIEKEKAVLDKISLDLENIRKELIQISLLLKVSEGER